jgi:hypothetical protein
MKIYVANCTPQVHNFVYRMLGQTGIRQQMIEVGRQVRLSGEMTSEEIDFIVNQHAKYGLIRDTEITRKTRGFNCLVYAVDRPVAVDNMTIVLELNREALVTQGQQTRKEAAVAVTNAIENEGPGLKALELSVVEEDRPGVEGTMAEGLRVTREEGPATSGDAPRRRRRG